MSGILGKKIGMTRIFNDAGDSFPVTVIQAGPCFVTQIKTKTNDGYDAIQLSFEKKKEKNSLRCVIKHFIECTVTRCEGKCESIFGSYIKSTFNSNCNFRVLSNRSS